MQDNVKEIYLAGGCFWGTEHYLKMINGVVFTEVGYANSVVVNPKYEEVCSGKTMAAEAVHVKYDASVISLEFLLEMYFVSIDPTSVNKIPFSRVISPTICIIARRRITMSVRPVIIVRNVAANISRPIVPGSRRSASM